MTEILKNTNIIKRNRQPPNLNRLLTRTEFKSNIFINIEYNYPNVIGQTADYVST